jgi:predicted transcriptional regulator
MKYPKKPGYKEKNGTSKQAADAIEPYVSNLHRKILKYLKKRKKTTPEDVAKALNADILSIRPRFSEMKIMGLICKTDLRQLNQKGKSITIWKLT